MSRAIYSELMMIPETIDAGPVTLQRCTADHASDLDQAINESLPELMPFLPWATADHGLEATTSYLVESQSNWDKGVSFNYALLTPDGEVVGSCGLLTRQGPDVFEIGYWIHSSYAGRGYATAVSLALAEIGLAQPEIDCVEIHHDVKNPASGRVAAKAGFRQVRSIEVERKAPGESGTHLVWERSRPSLMNQEHP
jgi:ribosomal-protein-serine acetyltransferase